MTSHGRPIVRRVDISDKHSACAVQSRDLPDAARSRVSFAVMRIPLCLHAIVAELVFFVEHDYIVVTASKERSASDRHRT